MALWNWKRSSPLTEKKEKNVEDEQEQVVVDSVAEFFRDDPS